MYGTWDYKQDSRDNMDLYNYYLSLVNNNHTRDALAVRGIQVPLNTLITSDATGSTEWYLSADLYSGNLSFEKICFPGTMSLVDTTHPTVKSITATAGDYYPGNLVPICVEFNEPFYGDYELVLSDGTTLTSADKKEVENIGTVTRTTDLVSPYRVFYYEVKDTDNVKLTVSGVKGVNKCKDVRGNGFKNSDGKYQECVTTFEDVNLISCRPQDSFYYISTGGYFFTDTKVKVMLKDNQAFDVLWNDWNQKSEEDRDFTVALLIDWDSDNPVPLTVKEDENKKLYLEGNVKLEPIDSGTLAHTVQILINGKIVYGFDNKGLIQQAITKADSSAYTISCENWPSGTDNTVFIDDVATATINAKSNNTEISFSDSDQFYWVCSDPGVISLYTTAVGEDNLTLASSPSVGIIANNIGTAEIYLMAKNGSSDTKTHTEASNRITVTVKDGGRPSLLFPTGANTVFARQGNDQKLNFASNLGKYEPKDGKINAELKDADGNTVWTTELGRTETSLTVP